MAGRHIERVVHALVSANKAGIDLSFHMATAIDLAGRNVFEAVQMSVNPKVIDTPPAAPVTAEFRVMCIHPTLLILHNQCASL